MTLIFTFYCSSCKDEFCYQISQKGSMHTDKPFVDMTYLKEWIEKIISGAVVKIEKVVK